MVCQYDHEYALFNRIQSVYRQYTYIVCKYIVLPVELFRPVSQRVQINCIFINNVSILCLSCNVKKSKNNN